MSSHRSLSWTISDCFPLFHRCCLLLSTFHVCCNDIHLPSTNLGAFCRNFSRLLSNLFILGAGCPLLTFSLMSGLKAINEATNNRKENIVMKQNGVSICINEADNVMSIVVIVLKVFHSFFILQSLNCTNTMRQEAENGQVTQCEEELCKKVANVKINLENESLESSSASLVDSETSKDKKVNIWHCFEFDVDTFHQFSVLSIWYEPRPFAKPAPRHHRPLAREIKTDLHPVFNCPKCMSTMLPRYLFIFVANFVFLTSLFHRTEMKCHPNWTLRQPHLVFPEV